MNGPIWSLAIVDIEPESTDDALARKRVIAQASRRVKRSEEDQVLITELSRQVDAQYNRAEATAKELAEYHEADREIAKAQKVSRHTGKTCIGKLSEFIGILTPNC